MSETNSGETMLDVRVWRGGETGAFQTFAVPRRANQTVLDVIFWIQRHLDPTLAFRYACRVGMCGSCAMTVNGRARWTCRTHVARVANGASLTVAPLRNLPVIKDLAADLAPFFAKWAKAEGRFVPKEDLGPDFAVVPPGSSQRQAADTGIECIGCAVCYAACDVVAWNPDYLGPAALNRAWTLHNDVRDGSPTRLKSVAGDAGCHSCHGQEGCRKHCPKHLDPTGSIAGLKRASALAALKGEL